MINSHKRKRSKTTCYLCGAKSTSDEHVPPKCIFPKKHRENLITVPSCDVHNSRASNDDQYLMMALFIPIEKNEIGRKHARSKGVRTIERDAQRNNSRFSNRIVDSYIIDSSLPTGLGFKLEIPRFRLRIEMIARGLYFHHHGHQKRLECDIKVMSPLIAGAGYAIMQDAHLGIRDFLNKDENTIKYGSNPEVFYYYLIETDGNSGFLSMNFYEGIPIYAIWDGTSHKSKIQEAEA